MKASVFKQNNDCRKIRMAKRVFADDAIGKIEKNSDTFILTFGQFSLIDVMSTILDQTGAANIIISSWTAAHAALEATAEKIEACDILSFKMIVDRSFKNRQPDYYKRMIELFGSDSIRELKTHAKFLVIYNDNWNIVVRTSMNLNENPRLENLEISESKKFVDFFRGVCDNIFNEVAVGENKEGSPELVDIEDFIPFNIVSSVKIKRKNLMIPRTSHEVS